MRVLIYTTGADTGGQGTRIAAGFARHAPDWQVDSIATMRSPLGYPETHLNVRDRIVALRRLYAEADVVHLRQTLAGYKALDNGRGKPVVLHHHGSLFRGGHAKIAGEARRIGATQIASTLDLTLLEPGVEWLPSPYNLDELAALRTREYQPSDRIRIAHFPTAKKVKSTDAFMAAVESLAKKYPIEVISNVHQGRVVHEREPATGLPSWPRVMARKAQADIYFDQVQLGYGNNAVEAWGMGIPVVAGVADPAVRALMVERFGSDVPFLEATEDTIEPVLERLIQSADLRSEMAAWGKLHVRRFHDDAVVVAQLQDVYQRAMPKAVAA